MSDGQPGADADATAPDAVSPRLLWTVAIGIMLVPLNSTMIAVALPTLIDDLDASVGSVSWLVTSYLAAMAILQPIGGQIGDRIGRRRLVLGGLTVFGVASAGAAAASSLELLIAFRVVQGVAGALMFPNGIALLREAVPVGQLGGRVGTATAVLPLAAAAGPPLGGLLLAVSSWHAIFVVNLPLIAVAIALGWEAIPRRSGHGASAKLGGRAALHLFRLPSFVGATGGIALSNLAMYVTVLGLPLLLAERGGWGHGGVGGALGAMFVAAFLLSPVGGRWVDLFGTRAPALGGLALQAGSLAVLAIAPGSIGAVGLIALLLASGAGIGISGPALQVAALRSVDVSAAGVASGAYSTSRYLGGIAGTVLLAGPLAPGPGLEGFGMLFAVLAVSAAGAATLALLLPGASIRRRWPRQARKHSPPPLASSPSGPPSDS